MLGLFFGKKNIICIYMGLRCEMCDDWLSMFQLSKLCETCYKTRTIVKAYSAQQILEKLEEHFLVGNKEEVEEKLEEKKEEKEEKKPNYYKNISTSAMEEKRHTRSKKPLQLDSP